MSQGEKEPTNPEGADFKIYARLDAGELLESIIANPPTTKEGANKQVISSQADSLIKISRIWADFFPANTSNQ
ncbi:hypothetical protein Q7I60_23670, partial [Escherichia coli]